MKQILAKAVEQFGLVIDYVEEEADGEAELYSASNEQQEYGPDRLTLSDQITLNLIPASYIFKVHYLITYYCFN
jgi:hypothetical protein